MAGTNNGSGFDDDPTCYSHLLLTDDFPPGLETGGCLGPDNSSPKMLCFGDYTPTPTGRHNSGPTCTGSDSVNLTKNKVSSTIPYSSNNKRNGSSSELIQDPEVDPEAPTRIQGKRKSRSDNSIGHAKVVKKEKLGERITALQQLVSPFGKTDTASVLHEASGYIRFLQDQVQVLCSPYLQRLPLSSLPHTQPVESGENKGNDGRRKDDLKSRGLCLVPLELTLHVAESNGADLWSSSVILNNVSSN